MVSIQTIAQGLSRQIESAIDGKADATQSRVLCDSVDTLIKLARLQLEMANIDWDLSTERPVIEMEKAVKKSVTPASKPATELQRWTQNEIEEATDDELKSYLKAMEKELSHTEDEMDKADGTEGYPALHDKCKSLRKFILSLRDNLSER